MVDDHLIATIGERQHGLLTLRQLTAAGMSRGTLDHRTKAGRLERVGHGVYRIAGTPRSWRHDLFAAVLAVGPSAAVSHRAAARAWGCWNTDPVPEVVTAYAGVQLPDGAIVHRTRRLDAGDVVDLDGLPVMCPARVAADLGAVCSETTVASLVDTMLRRELLTMEDLQRIVARRSKQGRDGIGVLRRVVTERAPLTGVTESFLEAELLRLCREAGLPEPRTQVPVWVDGRLRRLDAAYPEVMVAIEVDGWELHSRKPVFDDDRVRQNGLTNLGWAVLRFTWDQIRKRPWEVVADIRRTLRRLGVL